MDFRKVSPSEYKLFQVADLICTWELLALKAAEGEFTESEKAFFDSPSKFLKNRYKLIAIDIIGIYGILSVYMEIYEIGLPTIHT